MVYLTKIGSSASDLHWPIKISFPQPSLAKEIDESGKVFLEPCLPMEDKAPRSKKPGEKPMDMIRRSTRVRRAPQKV